MQSDLLAQLERSNRLATGWHLFLVVGSIILAATIRWEWVLQEPIYSLIAVSLVASQVIPGILIVTAKKKKRIEELSEGFNAGVFDKNSLVNLIRETAKSLGIDVRNLPFYLTRDKDLNAAAVSIGFTRLLPTIRGIYIHRQVLHVSTPQGLKATIGHELGHLFPYDLKWNGAILLKLAFGGLLALWVLQVSGQANGFGLLMAVAAAWGFLFLDSIPRSKMSQPIEYLCDGLGAKASGVEASITDLLNFGNESQAQYELSIAALKLAKEGRAINTQEAMEIYNDALGYGHTDVDATMKRIQDAVSQQKTDNRDLSIKGLLDFVWKDNVADSGESDARDQAIQNYEAIEAIPHVDWKTITQWQPDEILDTQPVQELIDHLRSNPNEPLFLLATELPSDAFASHPSFRSRIMYLWKNRDAIAALKV